MNSIKHIYTHCPKCLGKGYTVYLDENNMQYKTTTCVQCKGEKSITLITYKL